MKLVFERSHDGHFNEMIAPLDVPQVEIPGNFKRQRELRLPEVSQGEISRHYTELAKESHGVNDGFYPLGSCTMKYNPKINDEMANLPGFSQIHPLQPVETAQGALRVFIETEALLTEITGMDHMSFQPAAGAHGELTALLMFKAFHKKNGEERRNKIIVPDAAHGTNPASASMVGYETINIKSKENGCVDVEALRAVVGPDTAGLMLTNPSTVGIFEENILEITKIVHDVGGLNYYDGANLNPIMGIARPGDMGFDIVHLNIHKTFSTPHGGGGPGSGPIGCKENLAPFMPMDYPVVKEDGTLGFMTPENTIGRVKSFYGHFGIVVRALTYILTLGREGIPEAAKNAVLNANYMMSQLDDLYEVNYPGPCMHEFVLTLGKLKKETGVTALDISKGMLDYGIHPPTMYFPNVVPEALMVEPTETETKETIDEAVKIYRKLYKQAYADPDYLKQAPHKTSIRRVDEVRAARQPVLSFNFDVKDDI